jgi:hypothetical protein
VWQDNLFVIKEKKKKKDALPGLPVDTVSLLPINPIIIHYFLANYHNQTTLPSATPSCKLPRSFLFFFGPASAYK